MTILIFFGPNLPKKENSNQKQKKVNATIEFCIIRVILGPKFQLKLTTLIF